ncbi:uncharacterized protein LOC111251105 [Varroa destructor]|uniref:Uncharacterized protein n=1 Tax=Varroa destructor TaxID=109461 RepID=A0A7M7KB73_VARDE|nr:uncharacterized protein LOC111251105 [Varroa destructor]XP_022663141.1 uncharacterized protein LOC111251105 [Varroa destructor]XP_022663142.1 uncharacterized protein LOC111251105 [Varroa destructor]XP_022663143.1 uncharacterized protein LOC111251105 [Varroa destructor]XP_022663144.1 uncharacterized protein LOC111251105 [Varroa destructor]XP_022663145.1 uncharacterized protein LOC111251105 [Varroa destructor]XP_022663146.1 uncharacterized protein LOC111251105 [Varroa destructor]
MDSLWEDVSSSSSRNGDQASDSGSESSKISSISGVYSDLSDFDFDILENEVTVNQDKVHEYVTVGTEEVGSSPEPDWTICDTSPPPESVTCEQVSASEPRSAPRVTYSDRNTHNFVPVNVSEPFYSSLTATDDIEIEASTSLSIQTNIEDTDYRFVLQPQDLRENPEPLPRTEMPVRLPDIVDQDDSGVRSPCSEATAAKGSLKSLDQYCAQTAIEENCFKRPPKKTKALLKRHKLSKHSKKKGEKHLVSNDFDWDSQMTETCRHMKSYAELAPQTECRTRDFASGDTTATSRRSGKKKIRSCLKEFGASVEGEHFDVMRLHSWTTRQELEEAVQDHMDFVVRLRRQQENDRPYSAENALQQLRSLGVIIPAGRGR